MARAEAILDWRGVRIPRRAPPVAPALDPETRVRVCVACGRSLEGRGPRTRFCDHDCRVAFHQAEDRRRRARLRAETSAPPPEPQPVGVVRACRPRWGMWGGAPRNDICAVHGGPLRRRRGTWVHV